MALSDHMEVAEMDSDTVRLCRSLSAWQSLWPQNSEDLLPSKDIIPS